MNIKSYLCAAFLAFALQICTAQTAPSNILTTSGGYFSGASTSLSWTLGEPFIETDSSTNNFLTQGFQQPQGVIIASIDNINNQAGESISAYPNPASGLVSITSTYNVPLRVDVMDLAGRKLLSKNFPGNVGNQINLTEYSEGIYLFKFYSMHGQPLQTLKIDKIN
jgi:Secretion system C-terminal sorting domain